MANRLKMAAVEAILALAARGWPQRRIARELGVNRETVGRYVALARRRGDGAEGTSASSGGGEGSGSATLGPAARAPAPLGWLDPKPAKAPIGSTDPSPHFGIRFASPAASAFRFALSAV